MKEEITLSKASGTLRTIQIQRTVYNDDGVKDDIYTYLYTFLNIGKGKVLFTALKITDGRDVELYGAGHGLYNVGKYPKIPSLKYMVGNNPNTIVQICNMYLQGIDIENDLPKSITGYTFDIYNNKLIKVFEAKCIDYYGQCIIKPVIDSKDYLDRLLSVDIQIKPADNNSNI